MAGGNQGHMKSFYSFEFLNPKKLWNAGEVLADKESVTSASVCVVDETHSFTDWHLSISHFD